MTSTASTAASAAYHAARLMALAAPLDPDGDRAAFARATRRLQTYLGVDSGHAAQIARRCLLYRRDRGLHATLVLNAAPAMLRPIVEALPIDGLERLSNDMRGRLFLALHYGPYSSLLWLALARAMATAQLSPPTFLLNRGLQPTIAMPDDRWRELVDEGIISPAWLTSVDAAEHGRATVRTLAATLSAGGAVVVFPDAWFLPADARTALPWRIGQGTVGLPRGVQWLANKTDCAVSALRIQPEGPGYRIVLDPVPDVPSALQVLGDVVADAPAPWEGWTRDQPNW